MATITKKYQLRQKLVLFFFIPFSFQLSVCFAQIPDDTTNTWGRNKEGYKKLSKPRPAIRIAIGVQKSFFSELGISRHQYYYNDLGFAAQTLYTAIEFIPTFGTDKELNIYGIKIGYEINGRILALGVEGKYMTDHVKEDIIITPKVGFGFFGVINVFYGYNFSTQRHTFDKLGNNQLSINFNMNRHVLTRLKKK